MYPRLSSEEWQALVERYQHLPDDQAVDILDSPQLVDLNGGPPQAFASDEVVYFTRSKASQSGETTTSEGVIGIFVRRQPGHVDQQIWVVILTPEGRWFRIPITALTKVTAQTPLGMEG